MSKEAQVTKVNLQKSSSTLSRTVLESDGLNARGTCLVKQERDLVCQNINYKEFNSVPMAFHRYNLQKFIFCTSITVVQLVPIGSSWCSCCSFWSSSVRWRAALRRPLGRRKPARCRTAGRTRTSASRGRRV